MVDRSRSSRRVRRATDEDGLRGARFVERIEAERKRIFSAMSIIDCCRRLHESTFIADAEGPDIASALAAAHELLDQAAGELGCLADNERAAKR